MAHITILGTGSMGSAIANLARTGGHSVQTLGSSDTAAITGDIVVLAVPYPAIDGIIAARREQLAGRIVVDITNPLDFATFDALVVPSDASAAQQIAAQLPQSRVLKAFNTNFAGTLASGSVGSNPTTVLVAGDDAEAKQALIAVVQSAGLVALDAGALKRARELEAVGFLQISLAAAERISWTGGFAVIA